ncbi:MAG: DNA-binding protein WhiA [Clostridia bacterium]|nr:DNA-binding protein WhiA [Clostridia bacterium]
MGSFTNAVKEEILQLDYKNKKCCMFSMLYGFLFCAEKENDKYFIKTTNVEIADCFLRLCDILFKKKHLCYYNNGEISIESSLFRYFTIVEYKSNIFKCPDCEYHFLRSLFLIRGMVTDPNKSYLLELSFSSENKANELFSMLSDSSFKFKMRERQGKYVIYTKDSETVEDYLAVIGANNATFTVMNSKIIKDVRNRANRISNCDDANINKSLDASKKYINAINYLIKSDKISKLSEQLTETAYKRLEFPELNYTELGKKFNPVISKSGIFHRLEKIVEIYEETKKEE